MDVREMKPAAKKAAAGGKGHNGAALAAVFLMEDERSAREAIRVEGSMKDRLKKLCKLSEPDHIEFRATLEEKRTSIKAQAEAAKLSQADYFKSGPEGRVAASLITSVSLWQKLSVATQNGWTPDYGMAWADLSRKATEFNNSKATGNGKGAGAKGTPLLDKAKAFVKANIKDAKGMVKPEFIQPQEVHIGSSKVMQIPLVESIMLMLSMADAPDEVCDHLIQKVQQFKEDRAKARDAAKEAADKASASAKKDDPPAEETASPGEKVDSQPIGKVRAKRRIVRKPKATA